MFRLDTSFEPVNALRIEQALEAAGWTDVLRIVQGDQLLYEDRSGIANDLAPALAVLRERYLHGRASYEIALGKPSGVLDLVALARVGPIGLQLRISALDRQIEPWEGESLASYFDRVGAFLQEGWLHTATDEVQREGELLLRAAQGAGWVVRPHTVEGPWLELRHGAGRMWSCPLHERYGHAPNRRADQTLLRHFCASGVPGGADVRVRLETGVIPFDRALCADFTMEV